MPQDSKSKRKWNVREKTLPRRHIDMNNHIEISLQKKEREGIFNDVGGEEVLGALT